MADLIERDAALKKIDTIRKAYMLHEPAGMGGMSAICICRDAVKEVPIVNRWIPCSERLPESREGVIFTVDRGHPFVCVGYRINNEREKLQRWFDKLSGLNFSDYDVTSWMPMPEAYETEEVNE